MDRLQCAWNYFLSSRERSQREASAEWIWHPSIISVRQSGGSCVTLCCNQENKQRPHEASLGNNWPLERNWNQDRVAWVLSSSLRSPRVLKGRHDSSPFHLSLTKSAQRFVMKRFCMQTTQYPDVLRTLRRIKGFQSYLPIFVLCLQRWMCFPEAHI